jgi:hypothetical protein
MPRKRSTGTHRWGLAQHLRDVSPEELVRAAAEMFAAGSEDA